MCLVERKTKERTELIICFADGLLDVKQNNQLSYCIQIMKLFKNLMESFVAILNCERVDRSIFCMK